MLKNLREPVNSLTHWGGALLALIGLIILLVVARQILGYSGKELR